MTAAQTMRREGFLASLEARGTELSVTVGVTTTEFTALVEPIAPDEGEFSQAADEREGAIVHILREQVPTGIVQGTVFTDAAALVKHRVTKITDFPTNIAVFFTCESTPYTA